MSWLLDTNVLSELRKREHGNPGVRRWLEAHRTDEHFTSVLVMGEIRRGVEANRRRDPAAAAALDAWLRRLESNFSNRILPVDASIADLWGRLNVLDPLPAIDGLLAATALAHDLTLVTRNVLDVNRSGVRVVNPFVET